MKTLLILSIFISLIFAKDGFSYVEGRSGDIILRAKNARDNSLIYLINGEVDTSSLDDQSYADLVSHLLGGPIINADIDRDSFPKSSLFDKATGNVLFVVDSLDSESLAQFDDLKMVSQNGKSIRLAKTSYPQDTIASLATLSSGASPSVHGITGASWATYLGQINAYRAGALPYAQNLADSFSQTFEGKSLVYSSSSDFQMASAFAVNQFVHYPFNNEIGLYWNPNNRRFESVYANGINVTSLFVSATEITQLIAATPFAMPGSKDTITYVASDADYVVNLVSKNTKVIFSASDLTLVFAELQSVRNLLTLVQSDSSFKSMTADQVPDLFTFSFASLKGIERKYGRNSAHYRAVVYLIDEAIVAATKSFSSIYKKMAAQIVFMGPSADQTLAADGLTKIAVFHTIAQSTRKDVFDNNFPSIYLNERPQRDQACDLLKASTDFDVFCASESDEFIQHWPNYYNQTVPGNSTYGKDAAIFQICLWFPIILVLAMLSVICSFCYMDVGGDSMIYRSTNLRHQHSS